MARLDGAARYDAAITRGSDLLIPINIEGDYSDCTFTSKLRIYAGAPSVVMPFTVSNPSYSAATNTTSFDLFLSDENTSSVSVPDASDAGGIVKLQYDLKMTYANNFEQIILFGSIEFYGEITD